MAFAIVSMLVWFGVPGMVKTAVGSQWAWTYGYGTTIAGLILGIPLSFLIAFFATQFAAARARSRALHEPFRSR
jgi:hypothetical protein